NDEPVVQPGPSTGARSRARSECDATQRSSTTGPSISPRSQENPMSELAAPTRLRVSDDPELTLAPTVAMRDLRPEIDPPGVERATRELLLALAETSTTPIWR